MITVQYLADRNVLTVSGIAAPFPAGALQARRLGDLLAVASPHDGTLICAWLRFDEWARGDGAGFDDADSAFAYLDVTCARGATTGGTPEMASLPLGGHRVVRGCGDGVAYASCDDPSTASGVFGITSGAVEAGQRPTVTSYGILIEPSWAWGLGPVYCGSDGVLTQPAPASGFVLQVAMAIAPTVIVVGVQEPYHLAA